MARARPTLEVEALPESDRLDGFRHPRETAQIFGHDAAARTLAQALASGRLAHAWLLTGPEGIGKATLAYRFAGATLSGSGREGPETNLALFADSRVQRQVVALSHPGLILIRRPYDSKTKRFSAIIPVEEVRRLKSFFAHTATGEGSRVAIVDQADELNVSSANALLKTLEEPPPRTVILLITAQPGRLLPTIRSRCRVLRLAPLGAEALRRAAERAFAGSEHEPPAEQDWGRLVDLARGSVRRLLSLATSDGLKLDDSVRRLLSGLPTVDWGSAHALADDLAAPAAQQRFETFFDMLLGSVADRARSEAKLAGADATQARSGAWADLWETLVRERTDAAALNLDRKALILDSLSRLAAAARQ
jgi:DNA polymerase-3 subunit delta'